MNRKSNECGGCGSQNQWILHKVHQRGIYRHLCTSCVLKFNAGLFCPICFQVYNLGSSSSSFAIDRIMCQNCPSVSHKSCASSLTKGEKNNPHYQCPPCLNPNFVFFDVTKSEKGKVIDVNSAKVLVAAATISSNSMSKAASLARVDAERRVNEATVSRKRAKEFLEKVILLEKNENGGEGIVNSSPAPAPVVAAASALVVAAAPAVALPGPAPAVRLVKEQKKKAKVNNAAISHALEAQLLIQNNFKAMKKDTPGRGLNNVKFYTPVVLQKDLKNGVSDMNKMNRAPGVMGCEVRHGGSNAVKEEKKLDVLNRVEPAEFDRFGLVSRHTPQNRQGVEKEEDKSKLIADSKDGPRILTSS
ncbi:hypothetical protein MKW98_006359 [Papaver atlanticum]|uniref:Uncharacterized protein n=1 Tax=Papaver atlanticum TaxID=357466 RepID=A0AAD4X3W9_9MAGN|nr:hypothetical protein MKW98_006359 [Papaver atlanticum]